ncbi:4-hydroxybenzoate octaprenyltransferase [Candidatus Riesia pediculicola]|uniref:4-hydroxybenzoate octaprenyltransferase n=1 Tax=Candidatus Riesia pediculicola TaxID=401619 RepID=UPI0009C37757|nr:4-hydroxybenzoate octaprenyltransferase [Candidatus Riesia pediculicola]ARC54395.1 hypothetical protein AOE57_02315 [Candidatus Riesia pediculicola]
MRNKIGTYARISRLNKPIGFFLFLFPILWTFCLLEQGKPRLKVLLIFMFGTFSMRSAGCIINDLLDKDYDAFVKRTKDRPFPKKEIKKKEALILFSLFVFLSILLVFQLSYISIIFSIIVFILTIVYPLIKRFNHFPQVVLGISTGLSIPMIFFETVNNFFSIECLTLFLINLVWTLIYDTQYAMADKKYDIKIGLKSTAILFSKFSQTAICIFQFLMMIMLIYIGVQKKLSSIYFFSLFLILLIFLYQYHLISRDESNLYLKAFLSNGFVGCILFLGILLSYF